MSCVDRTRTRNSGFVQELLKNKQLLISYLREDGEPFGVVVAVKTPGGFRVGFSVCNLDKDRWEKFLGLRIAIGRALSGKIYNPLDYPHGTMIAEEVEKMAERANRYWRINQNSQMVGPSFFRQNLLTNSRPRYENVPNVS
jgi:hypothetical protein